MSNKTFNEQMEDKIEVILDTVDNLSHANFMNGVQTGKERMHDNLAKFLLKESGELFAQKKDQKAIDLRAAAEKLEKYQDTDKLPMLPTAENYNILKSQLLELCAELQTEAKRETVKL